MISNRMAPTDRSNDQLVEMSAQPDESNLAWLKRVGATDGILLLGGSSVAHFRIRVAQSHLRHDLTPSLWSLVGLLQDDQTFVSVPLELRGEASEIPRSNGVQECLLSDYDDPKEFPNIAIVRFTEPTDTIRASIAQVKVQRSIVDLPSLMLPWLGFIWGAGQRGNPLLEERGLPSAAFVETVYSMAGVELTPSLSSSASCPEAIWQAAKWWHDFYEQTVGLQDESVTPIVPTGKYALRQRCAAVLENTG